MQGRAEEPAVREASGLARRTGCEAHARAHANIALAKYWGKRDAALNLPAVGSLSIALEALYTDTTVRFDDRLAKDHVELDGRPAPAEHARISRFLDCVRERVGLRSHASVSTWNSYPTSAGLASSSSGFAALAFAATRAAGLQLSVAELSALARRGSGSAARSLVGGFALLPPGRREDGGDCYAVCLMEASCWPLVVVVAITDPGSKRTGSTKGMTRTAETSPYYRAWVEASEADLAAMCDAVRTRDFPRLAELAEHSAFKLHALMLSARPPLLYWNAGTLAALEGVRGLQAEGVPVFATLDAGPQVKAVCPEAYAETVAERLGRLAGVRQLLRTGLAGPPTVREAPP